MNDPISSLARTTQKAQPKAVALFVSDVHLQASMPRTTQAFLDFLHKHAINARQLYLLGDLFEYWAGDDDLDDSFNKQISDAIRAVSSAGVDVFWMAGNRDFLVGQQFAAASDATILPDPSIVSIGGKRLILAHGDAQCTDDLDYMAFRAKVRQPEWQQQFLTMPLTQRKAIIAGLRNSSREAQRSKSYEIMDVNPAAIKALFDATNASTMIHGHTHRPGRHEYQTDHGERVRYVLPDWDCDIDHPRGGWLSMNADGSITRFTLDGPSQTVS